MNETILNNTGQLEEYGATLLEFKVVPSCISGRAFDAFWTVEKTAASPAFVPRYNICISEDTAGPWFSVLSEPTLETSILGVGAGTGSFREARYIRLIVLDPNNRIVYASDATDSTHQMDRRDYLEYREQLRLENMALEKRTGFPGYLFKKIITECPCECADEILDGAFDSDCPFCFGTGKVGGYHPPIRMMADWSSSPKGTRNSTEQKVGISEVDQKQVKMMPYPKAAFKDIWADSVSKVRYEVVKSDSVLYKIFPTAQIVLLTLLPKSDPAYKLQTPTE